MSTINVVTHKQVVGIWQFASKSEELLEIMELAVDVSTNGDGRSYWLNIDFFNENLLGFVAKRSHLLFWNWLAFK